VWKKSRALVICATVLVAACVIIALSGHRDSKIVRSLPGYVERIWKDNGGIFEDRMEYVSYIYDEIYPEQILECEEFKIVDMAALKELKKFALDFEKRVDGYLLDGNFKERDFALNCSFYSSRMDEGDYYILYTDGVKGEPTYYEFYYFDLSEKKLHYAYADVEEALKE